MKRPLAATVPVTFFKERDAYVAYCPSLDLSTCGDTFQQARSNLVEAIEVFFDECVKRNTLNEALSSLGWQKAARAPRWQPPLVVGEERLPIHVPTTA